MAGPGGDQVSRLSTHILDTSLGRPAASVTVHLEFAEPGGTWKKLSTQQTDGDGRCANLLAGLPFSPGTYKLCFETGPYHAQQSIVPFYPTVEVVVMVREGDSHLHVPLLLSPYGYTTYRGS
jgi:5-hydroxyisourate hydrolase